MITPRHHRRALAPASLREPSMTERPSEAAHVLAEALPWLKRYHGRSSW